jgi:hypothetical protein
MGFSKIKGELTSRIGQPVSFGAPKDVALTGGKPSSGMIVDEVWVDPELNRSQPRGSRFPEDWGDYSFCAQLIRWGEGKLAEYSIRLAYYRRRCGEDWWEFASQMTVNSDWRTIKALCEKALAKSGWFQDHPSL